MSRDPVRRTAPRTEPGGIGAHSRALLFVTLAWAGAAAIGAQAPAAEETVEPAPAETGVAAEPGPRSLRTPVVLEGQVELSPDTPAATLTFMNREILRLRATVLGMEPEERVLQISERLNRLADAGTVAPIEVLDVGPGRLVTIDGETVLAIADADLDPLGGETLDEVTERTVERLRATLAESEELRAPTRLLRSIGLAAVSTLLFVLVLSLLGRTRRRLEARLTRRLDQALRETVASQIADRRQRVRALRWADRAISLVHLCLVAVAGYLWLSTVLQLFPFTRPWGEALGRSLVHTLSWLLRGILGAVPDLAIVALILFVTRGATRFSAALFDAVEAERLTLPGIHPETAGPTRRLLNMGIWLMALVAAYPYIPGSSTDAFKAIGVFSGLILSLGSTGIVSQIMSGFMLVYSRALREGEYVTVGDIEGTAVHIGLLSTKLRKPNGEETTIPNALVVARETTNHSRNEHGVNLESAVTIGYDVPWRQVHSLLEEAAERTEGLRSDPPPRVLQTALSDFYPEYRLVAKLEHPERKATVLTQLNGHIQDLFADAGVQIMSPHYVADPPEPVLPPKSTDGGAERGEA